MNTAIEREIKTWLGKNLPLEISHASGDWIRDLAGIMQGKLQSLENRHNLTIGTLGGSFSLSVMKDHKIRSDVSINDIDVTGGAVDALGTFAGIISGVVSGVVLIYIYPVVLGIVFKITAFISLTLASMLGAILTSNPVGWAFLVGIGIAAIAGGASAKEWVQENVKTYNLPSIIRDLVKTSSIHDKIDEKRGEITEEVSSQLKKKQDLRVKILNETTTLFKNTLREAAESARILIN